MYCITGSFVRRIQWLCISQEDDKVMDIYMNSRFTNDFQMIFQTMQS